MNTVFFENPDEARAWDMYVAGALASGKYDTINNADAMILERRKRMAPAESKPEREWIPHKPGDPMPCDGDVLVEVKMGNENYQSPAILARQAKTLNWTFVNDLMSDRSSYQIMAWRPVQ